MGRRITFSDEYLDIAEIWDWYDTSQRALKGYQDKIRSQTTTDSSKFWGLSLSELDLYFESQNYKLECLTSLGLLSSAEAALRMDYLSRVYEKRKDYLSRDFRDLYRVKERKVLLDDDILEFWKKHYPQYKQAISDYMAALKYRHWLAHGRYWNPKFGRKSYDVFTIYEISESILNAIKSVS